MIKVEVFMTIWVLHQQDPASWRDGHVNARQADHRAECAGTVGLAVGRQCE
jgi:hypothetical protein